MFMPGMMSLDRGHAIMSARSPGEPFCFNFMFIDEIQSNDAIVDHKGNDHCTFGIDVTLS